VSGWQLDKDNAAAQGNLLITTKLYPDLPYLVAACYIKIGDLYQLGNNPSTAAQYYTKVANDTSADTEQYQMLAQQRLGVITQTTPPSQTTPLFKDNFDAGINPAWTIQGTNFHVVNGQFVSQGVLNASVGDPNWQDYAVDFDLIAINQSYSSTTTGGFDVVVRKQDKTMNYISVQFHDLGDSIGWAIVTNGMVQGIAGAEKNIPTRLPGHYRIEVNGNQYAVYHDNALQLQITDDTFTHGNVGLISTGDRTQVTLDNFQVKPLGQ
jgi:hypothetical protein